MLTNEEQAFPTPLSDAMNPLGGTSVLSGEADLARAHNSQDLDRSQADVTSVPGVNGRRQSNNPSLEGLDPAAVLQHLMTEVAALRARMPYSNPHSSQDYLNSSMQQLELGGMRQVPSEPILERKPATARLNRCNWVEFKNLYLEEPVFAVDVLMGASKYYWDRRTEEREMRDRMETAKAYSSEAKVKALQQDREGSIAINNHGQGKRIWPKEEEMPERIRINSQPLLAILSEIADERWSDEPKVMLRPYKLLVAHEEEIRKRHRVLQALWGTREKPADVTKPLGEVPTYEPETLDDDFIGPDDGSLWQGQQSITSLGSHERRARNRLDLTTTYDALQDLEVLIEFLDVDVMPVARQYMPDSPSPNPKIHFRDLWYLYQPGQWVVLDERRGKRFSPDASSDGEHPANQPVNIGERVATLWRVLRTANGRPKLSPPNKHERNRQPASAVNPFSVRCYRIDFDGDRFGPIWVDFDFQPWDGERMIESLEIVPLRLLPHRDMLKKSFVDRGKRFMELRTPQHRVYSGPLVNHHPSGLIYEHVASGQRDVFGSVIVDFKETARQHPNMVLKLGFAESSIEYDDDDLTLNEDYPLYAWEDKNAGRWKERNDEIYNDVPVDERLRHDHVREDPFLSQYDTLLQGDYIDGSQFEEDELALLPVRVCAYILQRRRFALLRLDKMDDKGQDASNWNDLHLHRDHKETVKAQTMSHFRNKELRMKHPDMRFDLTQEKGMGLIILLHGVPGVGKTSTAECVAQLLGKPLFPITCGDLGTTASEVDANLNEVFSKAEKWGCVLLLDEADVFLASRDKGDLHRNAVVSVFLRILELYTGILFLTTNRIGVLDEAFMSRCHTQLYYPPLDEEQTCKIWETNLKRLQKRKGTGIFVSMDRILDYARHHFQTTDKAMRWNGRQIRNACQAAAALAEFDAFGHNDIGQVPLYDSSQPPVRLEVDHFLKVDSAMREFNEYMGNVVGSSFGAVATLRGERYDEFKPTPRQQEYGQGPSAQAGAGDSMIMRDGRYEHYKPQTRQQGFGYGASPPIGTGDESSGVWGRSRPPHQYDEPNSPTQPRWLNSNSNTGPGPGPNSGQGSAGPWQRGRHPSFGYGEDRPHF